MATAMSFRTPEMNWDANDLADELAKFKPYCNLIFTGPFSKKSEKEQASFILLWIGRQGIECFNSWTWANNEDKEKPGKFGSDSKSTSHQKSTTDFRDSNYSSANRSPRSQLTIFCLGVATKQQNANLETQQSQTSD